MAVCPNCGNQTSENAIFCDQCGTRLPQPQAAAAPPPPAPAGGSVICPACGAGNVPGEAFCDFCGSPLESPAPVETPVPVEGAAAAPQPVAAEEAPAGQKLTCPACGNEVIPGEAFCSNCGASLAQAPGASKDAGAPMPEPAAPVVAPAEAAPAPPAPEELAPPVAEEAVPPPAGEAAPVPVEAPVPATPAEAPAPAAAAPLPHCPVCGSPVDPGDSFCSNCGAALTAAPAPVPAPSLPVEAPRIPPAAVPVTPPGPIAAPAGPRLVISDSGAEIPLPAGREILIGREDPVSGIFPDVDMTPHGGEEGGISRRHARILFENGQYFIEDLDSTNYTFVNKQKLVPKSRHPLHDGDEIRLGRVAVVLRTGS